MTSSFITNLRKIEWWIYLLISALSLLMSILLIWIGSKIPHLKKLLYSLGALFIINFITWVTLWIIEATTSLNLSEGKPCIQDNDCSVGKCATVFSYANGGKGAATKVCCATSGFDATTAVTSGPAYATVCKSLANGKYCEANDWCASGACSGNQCVEPKNSGESCSNDNSCKSKKCAFTADMVKGVRTNLKRACCPGNSALYTNTSTDASNGVNLWCSQNLDVGKECHADNWCSSGVCANNVCSVNNLANYSECSENEQCASKVCAMVGDTKDSKPYKACCPGKTTYVYNAQTWCGSVDNLKQCHLDAGCKSGTCVNDECRSSTLAVGATCSEDKQCGTNKCGFTADMVNGVRKNLKHACCPGKSALYTNFADDASKWTHYWCAEKLENGKECHNDNWCKSGNCSNNTCAAK